MTLDYVSQILLVVVTAIIALIVNYAIFENNFNYFMYFEMIFLTLFVGLNVIDVYYLALVVTILAIFLYNAVAPKFKGSEKE